MCYNYGCNGTEESSALQGNAGRSISLPPWPTLQRGGWLAKPCFMEAPLEERHVPAATKWGACLPPGLTQDKAMRCAPRSADCSSAAAEWRRRLEEARVAKLGSIASKPVSCGRTLGCTPIQCVPLGKMVLPNSTDAAAVESDVSTTGKEGSSGDSSEQRK
eukprot:1863853-Amphidinium_carterae.1